MIRKMMMMALMVLRMVMVVMAMRYLLSLIFRIFLGQTGPILV